MLNQVVLVGRIVSDLEINETENERKVADITLAIPRSYKNVNGEYDTDFVTCKLWNAIAQNTAEYCKKGDLVGIKGRLQSNEDNSIVVIAEKVTFLSSKKPNEEE